MTDTAPDRFPEPALRLASHSAPAPVPRLASYPARVGPILGNGSHSWQRNRPFIALSHAENARRFKEFTWRIVLVSAGDTSSAGEIGT